MFLDFTGHRILLLILDVIRDVGSMDPFVMGSRRSVVLRFGCTSVEDGRGRGMHERTNSVPVDGRHRGVVAWTDVLLEIGRGWSR